MSELQGWIEALGRIGATGEGGVFRASYTPEELEAQRLIGIWMEEAGLRVSRDAAGNLWGRADGTLPDAAPIVVGSHIDSVKNGGKYDGLFGVLGGLMAVRETLKRHGQPRLPMEVVAFTGEEGSRFPIGLMGSKMVTGTLERRILDQVVDERGESVAEAMRGVGLDPDRIGDARRRDIEAYLEMHIEQGPFLEDAGIPLGVVEAIVGVQRVDVTVQGRADHAGTTPMRLRKDALLGAARMISRLPELAMASGSGVMTVGRIAAYPGSANVVPERVEFTMDIRHSNEDVKQQVVRRAREMCEEVGAELGLGVTWKPPVDGHTPVVLPVRLRDLLRDCCRQEGIGYMDMPSGAGHDAQIMAGICPTGMLFIPCKGGRSHTPEELATPEAMDAGVRVLSRCLLRLAYEAS